jgi:putative PIN family toxin of toxin-antitoxin system
MRVVLDTNVLFAAFVARTGLCAQIVESTLAQHDLFLSQHILAELTRHLCGKARLDQPTVDGAIESLLASAADVVDPAPTPPDAVRDPQDAAILGTAVASRADVLVSGDKDLLVLGSYDSIPILSPRQFCDRFLSPEP